MKHFKRACKILVSNLVDVFPSQKNCLPAIIKEILNFSRAKVRLLRHVFTQVGMQIFFHILTEVKELKTLSTYFKKGAKKDDQRVDQVNKAIEFFMS